MVEESLACPRRQEMGQDSDGSRFPLPDHWREDQTCSYCGSLNPDLLMAQLEAEAVHLGSTDKSYKVYVHGLPPPNNHAKFYFQHFDEGHRKRFLELMNGQDERGLSTPKLKFEGGYGFYVLPFFVVRKP